MTELLAYPRLRHGDTIVRLHEIREIAHTRPHELAGISATAHPRAEPVPTGASIAGPDHIAQVRSAVLDALNGWLTGRPVPRDHTSRFDLVLGRVLNEELRILPADAAHDETWSFLSAVVMPDIVWYRFPDLHQDRVVGKRHRNTLRRAWFRYSVVGDLQESASHLLGEDEMTGLFERTQVAGNRELLRECAKIILASGPRNRTEFARTLMKGVTALTGPYLLDGLEPEELRGRIDALNPDRRMAKPAPVQAESPPTVTSRATSETESAPAAVARVTGADRTDVVKRFHKEILGTCESVEDLLGRRPGALIRMISQLGGVEAARAVVGETRPSDTFVMLWERGRLDLTLESLVLKDEFRGLFADALLDQAAARLDGLGRALGRE